eukprot:TRINITY_DN3737_c0_g1_i1.p7 TRINITY_DN3737_c0_g1~~TRINITY_DN3737_c0_g1_i1.p7  ORF type:complete len:139 (-),score=5.19 TRINITY_DN3737_c0_g1_i1:843-1259(-)
MMYVHRLLCINAQGMRYAGQQQQNRMQTVYLQTSQKDMIRPFYETLCSLRDYKQRNRDGVLIVSCTFLYGLQTFDGFFTNQKDKENVYCDQCWSFLSKFQSNVFINIVQEFFYNQNKMEFVYFLYDSTRKFGKGQEQL